MKTYFIYSDEYGAYKENRTQQFISSHPYYIRSVLIIAASEWKTLNNQFLKLKRKYRLPTDNEVKWSYLWSLRQCKSGKKTISEKDDYYFLKDFDYHDLIDFVDESLSLINSLKYKKIIFTIAENSSMPKTNELDFYKMHLRNIMQRSQYELQHDDNLGLIFFDELNSSKNKYLKNACHEIFCTGDFVKNYTHLKSSLIIDYSHHNVGIQLADYIAGAIGSYFKGLTSPNYERGVDMFNKYIKNNLRKSESSEILGWGILNVPTQPKFKLQLKKVL